MKPLAILVTGWRRWPKEDAFQVEYRLLVAAGNHLDDNPDCRVFRLIHGGGRGVDAIAADHAAAFGLQQEVLPAKWHEHGRAAGPIRNSIMVASCVELREQGWDVICLAFPGPNNRGTWDCVQKAKQAGIRVEVRKWEE